MEADIIRETKIVLELAENEAIWLKGIFQNPLYPYDVTNEPKCDSKMREKIWNALSSVGVL